MTVLGPLETLRVRCSSQPFGAARSFSLEPQASGGVPSSRETMQDVMFTSCLASDMLKVPSVASPAWPPQPANPGPERRSRQQGHWDQAVQPVLSCMHPQHINRGAGWRAREPSGSGKETRALLTVPGYCSGLRKARRAHFSASYIEEFRILLFLCVFSSY